MKTPKSYQNNIKNRIITKEMLVDCLYSSNKRAKNYRDKEREYREYSRYNRYFYDKYDNIGKYEKDPIYFYYLFYDLNSAHSFHTPIKEKDISKKYSDLKIVEINELNTFGATIENLISNQFVKKVIELIKSGDYTLILD